ncbi:hypothetical protein [Enterovirga sp. CN4-39]|uniref:hypothetical protein n=1 Tax=Enterovirga sp. CN4-39 TaxID=3400910 RepID=UPI003C0E3420
MRSQSVSSTNVVRFPGPRAARSENRDQKGLLDTVYTNGSFVIAAEDRETKMIASRLQIFGFLNIAEIRMDGSVRALRPSEAATTSLARPWRLSRPSFDELPPAAS